MRTALVGIGRLENRYAREWVEWHLKIGFDHIFIADNNRGNEERFEDVVGDYVKHGMVTVVDFRDRTAVQLEAYNTIYKNYGKDYDWVAFFDFDEFSTRTVGPSWRKFTPEQKEGFKTAFTDLLRNTYIDTLDEYDGQKIRFTGEVVANNGKRVEVQMEFLTSKQAHPVAFRMLEKNGRWVVYDVLIEGISMIKNYRDQFRDILAKGDPQTLIERVQAKALEQKEKKAQAKKEAK